MTYPQEILMQARRVHGVNDFSNFELYNSATAEARKKFSDEVRTSYYTVLASIEKMLEYGENKWFLPKKKISEAPLTPVSIRARKKKEEAENAHHRNVRIFYQLFDCGMDLLVIPHQQLMDDIFSLLQPYSIDVTSYTLRFYINDKVKREKLLHLLAKDKELAPLVSKHLAVLDDS